MKMHRALKLCLVIGPSNCKHYNMYEIISRAIRGGVTMVQLRDIYANENEIFSMAKRLKEFLPLQIPLVIDDHVCVAQKLELPVHIGQSDLSYKQTRKILGEKAIIGLSIENEFQAIEYKGCGANYFGIGPIFSTYSKPNAAPPIGLEKLVKIRKTLDGEPCIAIGGINAKNVHQIFATGVEGVAVISAITKSEKPELSAQLLRQQKNCEEINEEEALSYSADNRRLRQLWWGRSTR